MAAISTMRTTAAAPRVAVARRQTVKVVARGSWRESSTATVTPQASSRPSSNVGRVSPTRSVLPANWRQELESLRNGSNGSSSSASSGSAPARSSSASWRDSTPAASAPRSSSAKKPVTPTRSSLPSNWKQELESLRGGSSNNGASSYEAPARSSSASWRNDSSSTPSRSSSASWRSESSGPSRSGPSASAPRSTSAKKPVTPTRSSLPANWKQELESLRGGSSNNGASSYEAPARSSSASWRNDSGSSAPARSSSASWRDASPAAARPSSPRNKTVTPSRSSLPANWKQELEALRGGSASNSRSSSPAASSNRSSSASWRNDSSSSAPARSSSASWRSESASKSSRSESRNDRNDSSSGKQGTNPWTGKAKVEIKRTPLPADWRKGL